MNLSWTDEQQILRESVLRLLEKSYDFEARQRIVESDRPWSAEIWCALADLGVWRLPFSEDVGGFGGKTMDIVAIAEIFGAHLLVEPFVSSILLGGRFLAQSDSPAAKTYLDGVICGEKIVAFAHDEGKGTAHPALVALDAKKDKQGFILNGEKRMVLGGAEADILGSRPSSWCNFPDGLRS